MRPARGAGRGGLEALQPGPVDVGVAPGGLRGTAHPCWVRPARQTHRARPPWRVLAQIPSRGRPRKASALLVCDSEGGAGALCELLRMPLTDHAMGQPWALHLGRITLCPYCLCVACEPLSGALGRFGRGREDVHNCSGVRHKISNIKNHMITCDRPDLWSGGGITMCTHAGSGNECLIR